MALFAPGFEFQLAPGVVLGSLVVAAPPLGASYGWYSTAVHQLEADGWVESGEQYVGGPSHDPATYTRATSLGFVVL